ncbi:MAG: alcohol dehydrogenase catalytic domain-containing protein [Planctomycetes bacterium]|nr:alcohol dehydrogenase catalytic domain-containing protein [Planctomycetota bacterium]
MRAVEFTGDVVFRDDYADPRPARGEVVVEVIRAGVCRTDLEIVRGYMNFRGVLGHEFVGRVAAGPARWRGKRVVAEINCVCGRCGMCRSGLRNHCRERTVLGIHGRDGVFADKVAVPIGNLHEVPDGLSDDEAVMVEPLAAAFQLVRQVRFERGQKVVVLGDGTLGQLIARVVHRICPSLVLVGKHSEKLELAEKVHIQTAEVGDFVPRQDADVVVDATGAASGLALACRAVRPRGTIVLKSTYAGGEPVDLSSLVINEVTLIGSRCGPFADALNALARHEVDVTNLVSRHMSVENAIEALELAARSDVVKVILDMACGR